MFTGIVQGIATVERLEDAQGIRTLEMAFPAEFCKGLEVGASVAIDGVCLTVTDVLPADRARFDVMVQSLRITTLAHLAVGDRVNAERAAKEGAEIGGHLLSGHVDCCATVLDVRQQEANYCIRIGLSAQWMRYVFAKGYIAINGASLTIAEVDKVANWFEVWLIPETRRMTTFEAKHAGAVLNIEIERSTQVMVDTVRDAVAEKLEPYLEMLRALGHTPPSV